jgi:hypothetical protein
MGRRDTRQASEVSYDVQSPLTSRAEYAPEALQSHAEHIEAVTLL